MIRRAFLRRMLFAAAACAFFDAPLPRDPEPFTATEALARLDEFYGRPFVETIEAETIARSRELAERLERILRSSWEPL